MRLFVKKAQNYPAHDVENNEMVEKLSFLQVRGLVLVSKQISREEDHTTFVHFG